MESLRKKWRNLPLRRFFILTVLGTVGLAAALSGLVIWGCSAFRGYLLPEADAVYLTIERTLESGVVTTEVHLLEFGAEPEEMPRIEMEMGGIPVENKEVQQKYAIQKIEKTFDSLTPKRKLAYQALGIMMVAAPAVFSFAGIFWCGMYFYRRKLKEPLELLGEATEKIAGQDLDFIIDYKCSDEMGQLSRSFERMRQTLRENNRAMWEMLEERRLLQASVAHDLRNPIAIIQGYTEYLEGCFARGKVDSDKLGRIVSSLNLASKRLSGYTDSVGRLNQWEDAVLCKKPVMASRLAEDMAEDFRLLALQEGMTLRVENALPDREILVDEVICCRVLENLVSNALRYARHEILLEFSLEEQVEPERRLGPEHGAEPEQGGTKRWLLAVVTDDGEGFPEEILKKKRGALLSAGEDGHMGIGLSVSRILCKKHGGGLELGNGRKGAWVRIWVMV